MKTILIGAVALAGLAILGQWILPWWGFVLIAMLLGMGLEMRAGAAFLCGFLTMAILWGVHTWLIDGANAGQLSAKMGSLLQMGSAAKIWWITILLGALLGGFGMMTGSLGRSMVLGSVGPTKKNRYRNKYR